MEIKDFIKARRKQLKMSLQTLGDAISYTPQAIARFENGKVKVDIRLIDDLIKALNVSLTTFLNGDIDNIVTYNEDKKFDEEKFLQTYKYYKEKCKISQSDLASKLNINKNRMSKIDRGISFPTIEEFKLLCEIFNISYETLYYGIIEEPYIESNNDSKQKTKSLNKINKVFLSLFIIFFILFGGSTVGLIISNINDTDKNLGSQAPSDSTPIYYTVTYHYDLSDETVTDYVYAGRYARNLEYIHEGYNLIGYYLGDELFDFSTPITSDITLTGRLEKKNFDIYFYDYYGDMVSHQVIPYLEDALPPTLEPISNLEFKGWSSEEYLNVRKNASIYPLYDSYTTRVYFDLDGGKFNSLDFPKYIDNFKYEDLLTIPEIIKKGYSFLNFTFNNEDFTNKTVLERVMTLKAKYSINQYKISFKYDLFEPIYVNYLDEVNLPLVSIDNTKHIRKYYLDDNSTLSSTFKYTFDRDIEIRVVFEGSNFIYNIDENDNSLTLINYSNEENLKELFIPSFIDGYKVKKISSSFLENDNYIESLIIESEDIIIEQNAFCSLPNLNFVDFSSITNGQFENNIFSLCPNITYLKLAKAKIKNSNEIDYILKNYGLIQNNNLTLEIASNFDNSSLPLLINEGFGKIKKLVISSLAFTMLDKENFDWDTLHLEEFNYEGNANLYLNLTSSFTQKELTFNSNYITLKSNSLILDKVTFNNDLLLNDGLKGNFKSKIVEFKKSDESERTISIGPSSIYATKIIIGSRNIYYDEINSRPCFYPLDENGITIYTYWDDVEFKEKLINLCSITPTIHKIDF